MEDIYEYRLHLHPRKVCYGLRFCFLDPPPKVNFTNILWASFTHADPKSAKNTDDLTVFFPFKDLCALKAEYITWWWNRPIVDINSRLTNCVFFRIRSHPQSILSHISFQVESKLIIVLEEKKQLESSAVMKEVFI